MLYERFKKWEEEVACMKEKGSIDTRDPGLTLSFVDFVSVQIGVSGLGHSLNICGK